MRGGAKAGDSSPAAAASEGALFTGLLIALWYATSVVNNQTSKVLVASLGADVLTCVQFMVASLCGAIVLSASAKSVSAARLGFASRGAFIDTAMLAGCFLAGASTLNMCLASMHVSLAMVLRAAEPFTTLVLSALMLPASEQPSRARAAALIPVVLGCALSAIGAHGPTATALLLVTVSNLCFSLRAILGKRVARLHGSGAVRLFFQMCVLGAALQAMLVIGRAALAAALSAPIALPSMAKVASAPLVLLLSGVAFYSQLQCATHRASNAAYTCVRARMYRYVRAADGIRARVPIAQALLCVPRPHVGCEPLPRQLDATPRNDCRRGCVRTGAAVGAQLGGCGHRVSRGAAVRCPLRVAQP